MSASVDDRAYVGGHGCVWQYGYDAGDADDHSGYSTTALFDQVERSDAGLWRDQMLRGDKSNMPGMVRASFGCYSNKDDVDRLIEMLERVGRGQYEGDYRLIKSTGEYVPAGYKDPLAQHFLLDRST